jgi:hypothetical protein
MHCTVLALSRTGITSGVTGISPRTVSLLAASSPHCAVVRAMSDPRLRRDPLSLVGDELFARRLIGQVIL